MRTTSKNAHVPLTVALLAGIGLVLGGCSADSDDKTGKAGSTAVEQDATQSNGNDAPADTTSKDIVDEDGKVPDWLAEGFPLYPGSKVAASGESGGFTIISFSVPSAEEQEIYDWFVAQYTKDGWATKNQDDESKSFEAENSDGRVASVDVTKATFVISASMG